VNVLFVFCCRCAAYCKLPATRISHAGPQTYNLQTHCIGCVGALCSLPILSLLLFASLLLLLSRSEACRRARLPQAHKAGKINGARFNKDIMYQYYLALRRSAQQTFNFSWALDGAAAAGRQVVSIAYWSEQCQEAGVAPHQVAVLLGEPQPAQLATAWLML
jgi:hypothetical protein